MNITRNTTDAEIFAPVDRAREALAEGVKDEAMRSDRLAGLLNALADAEGVARVRHSYRQALVGMLDLGHSFEDAVAYAKESAVGHLLSGPDDTWSGRKNDVRRAFADGVREAASYLIRGY